MERLDQADEGTPIWEGDFIYRFRGTLRVRMIVDAGSGEVITIRGYDIREWMYGEPQ